MISFLAPIWNNSPADTGSTGLTDELCWNLTTWPGKIVCLAKSGHPLQIQSSVPTWAVTTTTAIKDWSKINHISLPYQQACTITNSLNDHFNLKTSKEKVPLSSEFSNCVFSSCSRQFWNGKWLVSGPTGESIWPSFNTDYLSNQSSQCGQPKTTNWSSKEGELKITSQVFFMIEWGGNQLGFWNTQVILHSGNHLRGGDRVLHSHLQRPALKTAPCDPPSGIHTQCGPLPHCSRVVLYDQEDTAELIGDHFQNDVLRHWCFVFTLPLSVGALTQKETATRSWASPQRGPRVDQLKPPPKSCISEVGSRSSSPSRAIRWLQLHETLRQKYSPKHESHAQTPDPKKHKIIFVLSCCFFR